VNGIFEHFLFRQFFHGLTSCASAAGRDTSQWNSEFAESQGFHERIRARQISLTALGMVGILGSQDCLSNYIVKSSFSERSVASL